MSDLHHVSKFAERRRRNNIWRSVVTGIAAVVVFCTTYALILPAITMETEGLSCGMEAHTHTEECCQLTCGKREYFSHTHTEECYEEEELICPLEERTIHHHTDACYSSAQPICGLSQCEPHAHSEGCYGLQNVLICGQSACEPHAHGESCYTDGALTCTLEETAGHTHTEECYEEQQALTCTLEETEGHTHTEECYPSDFEPKLICEQEDIPEHRHTEDCYIRTCEKEAHIHTDECVSTPEAFLQNQNVINPNGEEEPPKIDWTDPAAAEEEGYYLICGNQEEDHIHSQDCYLLSEDLVDWSDPTSAEAAGFVLLCEEESEEHVHTEDCYAFDDSIQGNPHFSLSGTGLLNGGASLLTQGSTLADKVATQDMLDLSGYITKIDVTAGPTYNKEKNEIEASLNFTFYLSQTNGKFPSNNFSMELQGLDLTKMIESGNPPLELNKMETLKDSAGENCGTYQFTKGQDGKYYVQIHFSDEYLLDDAHEYIQGFVFCGCYLDKNALDEEGNFNTTYKEGVSVKFTTSEYYPGDTDTTLNYHLSTEKTGGYVQEDNQLVYTIYVKSTKGTPDTIKFTDTMTVTGGAPDQLLKSEIVVIEKGVVDENGACTGATTPAASTSESWSYSEDNKVILNMDLSGLSAGGYYKIICTYELNDLPDGTYDYSFNNGVNVTASQKGQTVSSGQSGISSSVSNDYTLAKKGERSDEKITWTITVNKSQLDISGMELSDAMFSEAIGDIVVTSSDGTSDGIAYDSAQKKYTFSGVGESGENRKIYTITYQTDAKPGFGTVTKTNKAELKKDNNLIKDAKYPVSYSAGDFTKSSISVSPDADGLPLMEWEITVDVPSGGIQAGTTIIDYCDQYGNDGNHQILNKDNHLVSVKYADGEPVSDVSICFYPSKNVWNQKGGDWAESQKTSDGGGLMEITFNSPISYQEEKMPLKISYTSKANSSGTGTAEYWNVVESGTLKKQISTSYDFPVNPVVYKKDKNDNVNQSFISQDAATTTWKVEMKTGKPSSNTITLTDVLPEGTALNVTEAGFLKIYHQGDWNSPNITLAENGSFNVVVSDYCYRGSYTPNNRTLEVTIENKDNSAQPLPAQHSFYVEYVCKLDQTWIEENKGTNNTVDFVNTATVDFGNEKVIHASQTQTWKENGSTPTQGKKLEKKGTWVSDDRIVYFELKINSGAENLSAQSDMIQVSDTLTYQRGGKELEFYLVPGSIKLYAMNSDGTAGVEIPGTLWNYHYSDNTSGLTSQNKEYYNIEKKIDVVVPDERALVLQYQYKVVMSESSGFNVNNTAEIVGLPNETKASSSGWNNYLKQEYGAGVVTANSYSFVKKSAVDGTPLQGAKFGIWKAVQKADNTWDWEPTEVTSDQNYTRGDYTSSSAGTFVVKKTDGYESNVLYMIKEIEAPQYYALSQNEYRFYFSDSKVQDKLPPVDNSIRTGAVDLTITNGTAEVEDKLLSEKTSITIVKNWKDTDGTELTEGIPESVAFDLYYREKKTTGDGTKAQTVMLPVNNQWFYTVFGLDKVIDGKEVEYYFVEQPIRGFASSSTVSPDGQTVTFTNRKTDADRTTITVQKSWSAEYTMGAVPENSVKFKLFRRMWDSIPTAEQLKNQTLTYEEYSSADNLVTVDGNSEFSLTMDGGWEKSFVNLPASEVVEGVKKYYSYYIVEEPSSRYDISYGDAREVTSGTLQVTNTLQPTYTLPNTGGAGTGMFTVAGLAVSIGACLGLMTKRRRGNADG